MMPILPRVLIVDYDPKALRTLSDLFTESGYQVDTAKDGPSALAMFRETRPAAVLLEAMIPKKHGFEVCQEIKRTPEGKSTPVIIMTAVYKGRKYRTQAMHVHGCDEYVEKPCAPEVILEIVRRMVPPGPVPHPVAAGRSAAQAGADRRGEVIPFPSPSRAADIQSGEDADAEREIMSKLDAILPDTPIFDERGFGTAMGAGSPAEPALDFEIEGLESLNTGGDLVETAVMPSHSARTAERSFEGARQDGARPPVIDAEFETSAAPATRAKPVKRQSQETQAARTAKLAQSRRRSAKPDGEKRARLAPRWLMVLLGLAVLVAVATHVLNRL